MRRRGKSVLNVYVLDGQDNEKGRMVGVTAYHGDILESIPGCANLQVSNKSRTSPSFEAKTITLEALNGSVFGTLPFGLELSGQASYDQYS